MEWDRHLVIRLPRFSLQDFEKGMEGLWKNQDFRDALRLAAPSWLEDLDWSVDLEELPLKLQHTLWKYANRMCHRSTPFGAFTGMGVWKWGEELDTQIDQSAFKTCFRKRRVSFLKVNPYLNPLTYPFGSGVRFFTQEMDFSKNPWKMKEVPFLPVRENLFTNQYLPLLNTMGFIQDEIQQICFEPIFRKNLKVNEGDLAHTLYTGKGRLDKNKQKALSYGVKVLEKLGRPVTNTSLEQFKKAFRKRFEYRSVPVLEAIDPDMGVDYPIREAKENNHSWTAVHSFLMEQWMETKRRNKDELELNLDNIPEYLPEKRVVRGASNTALMFSVLEDRLWLKQVCPLSSISLIARMIPFDFRVERLVGDFVSREKKRSTALIHADIIYQGEEVMNKVSFPFGLRAHQLVLSPVQENHQEVMDWGDLVLKMQDNELILFSLKYQKRIIPHLNSAYNSSRDEMPLFRLLADLQYDGVAIHPAFHLKDFFPGLTSYPRVASAGVILQPATWIISAGTLKDWKLLNGYENKLGSFKEYADKLNLPYRFLWKQGDQGLVFDRRREPDMKVFISLWNKHNGFILEEWLFEQGSVLKGCSGEDRYAHEFLAFYFSSRQTHQPLLAPADFQVEREKIDQEWVSIYVYLEAEQQDRFLSEQLLPVIRHQTDEISISFKQWHFLRFYDDYGTHLRIRFQFSALNVDSERQAVVKLFHFWNTLPYVKRASLHPYLPETLRYQYLGIGKTEYLFQQSSKTTLLRTLSFDFQHRLAYALSSLFVIYQKCPSIVREIEHLLVDGQFWNKDRTRQWNDDFRTLRPLLLKNFPMWSGTDPFLKAILKLNIPDEYSESAPTYFISIFHMHINRVFPTHQSETERGCYHLLSRLIAFFKVKDI